MENDIAVIGLACKMPNSENKDAYWANLIEGKDCISRWDKEDRRTEDLIYARGKISNVDLFDAKFFSLSDYEAALLDPQHRILFMCVWEAIEDAGLLLEEDNLISLYASCGKNTYIDHLKLDNLSPVDTFQNYIENASDFLPTRLGYLLNLKGECVNIQTACSSSLVVLHTACQSLLTGNSDVSIVGASYINLDQQEGYKYQKGMIFSNSGFCKPFDHKSDGQVDGDGCGVVILKRLDDAKRDNDQIYAVIKSTAINNDGKEKVGYTAPSIQGQINVIKTALDFADINPETIQYVEAHASATPMGDPIEFRALTKAYRAYTKKENYCTLSSVKGNIGHLNHAAGMAGLIKAILSIKNDAIPGTKHFKRINPNITIEGSPFKITSNITMWDEKQIRRAAVSSFGIGGTNAHVILEEAPSNESGEEVNQVHPIWVSAKDEEGLKKMKQSLLQYLLKKNGKISDISYTLCCRRNVMEVSWGCIVASKEQLIQKLQNNISSELEIKDLDGYSLSGKICALPSYPFRKEKYWYNQIPSYENSHCDSRKDSISRFFYFPKWERKDNYSELTIPEEEFILIIADEDSLISMLCDFLSESKVEYLILPEKVCKYDLEKIITQSKLTISKVIYRVANQCNIEKILKSDEWIEHYSELGYKFITRIEILKEIKHKFELFLITDDSQIGNQVSPNTSLNMSVLIGMVKIVNQEYSHITTKSLDFSKNDSIKETVGKMLREIFSCNDDIYVMFRNNQRLILSYSNKIIYSDISNNPIEENDTFVITGGTGKMALAFTEYLSKYSVNIILLARNNPFKENIEPSDSQKRVRDKINHLRLNQANIEMLEVDVTDKKKMEETFTYIEEKFEKISGVFHTAGAANSKHFKFLKAISKVNFEEVLQAKIKGALVIAELTNHNKNLKFVLNCSSLSTIFGGITFGAYSAGNKFLDMFTEYQRKIHYRPWVSVNWETWNFNEEITSFGTSISETSIYTEDGQEALDRILKLLSDRVVICTESVDERMMYIDESFKRLNNTPNGDKAVLNSKVEDVVYSAFLNFFKVDEIDLDRDFFALGGTSLEVLTLISNLENTLYINLPLDEAFDALTINKMTALCKNNLAQVDDDKYDSYELVDIDGEVATILIKKED